MKATPRPSQRHPWPRHTRIGLAVALAFGAAPAALALPTGEQVVSGQVAVGRPSAQSMVVQQGSARAILNWNSFSIGTGEGVSFQQPSAASVILNRVVQQNASEIAGRLSANGRVFLVNPSGVLFARGASVDVGALVASTLDISNSDFLAGRLPVRRTGDLIYLLVEDGVTALVTTHYMDEAEYCGRLGIMREGRLLALDTPTALKANIVPGNAWDIYVEADSNHPQASNAFLLMTTLESLQKNPAILRAGLVSDHLRAITPVESDAQQVENILLHQFKETGISLKRIIQVYPSLEDVFLWLSTVRH